MLRTAALILALVATPAAAQTTRCGWEFGKWVCRTEQPRPRLDPLAGAQQGYEQSQRMMDDFRRARAANVEAQRQAEADRQAASAQITEGRVAEAIRAGRCEDAKNIALDAVRIDLAESAARLCKPSQ